jgi:hypothetical protein
MASIISAGTTSATALNMSADTTGILQLASNNGTVALTVNTSQNIGIGTSSPATKLHVNTTTGGVQVRATSDTDVSFSAQATGVDSTAFVTVINDARQWTLRVNGSASDEFQIRDSTAGINRMTFDTGGNVFVGGNSLANSTGIVYSQTNAKAWVSFNSAGTINNAYNVSSVTRPSTGNYTVAFSTALANGAFCATANSWQSVSTQNVGFNVLSFSTTQYTISTTENGVQTNPNAVYSIVMAS